MALLLASSGEPGVAGDNGANLRGDNRAGELEWVGEVNPIPLLVAGSVLTLTRRRPVSTLGRTRLKFSPSPSEPG